MRDQQDEQQRSSKVTSPEDAQKTGDKRRRQRYDAVADEDNPLICRGID